VVMSEEQFVQGQIVRTMVGCQWWYKWLYVRKERGSVSSYQWSLSLP